MQPSVQVEGKDVAYWQAELTEGTIKDQSWTLRMYISDPETIKKINAGSLIGLSIGKGFQEGHRTMWYEPLLNLPRIVGEWLEELGLRLQGAPWER